MADEMGPTFSRFLDLAPELRAIIYKMYIKDFASGVLVRPTQPPLTRVCRLTRNEALPIFYSTCTTHLQLRAGNDFQNTTIAAERFLQTLTAPNIGAMRSVEVAVYLKPILQRS